MRVGLVPLTAAFRLGTSRNKCTTPVMCSTRGLPAVNSTTSKRAWSSAGALPGSGSVGFVDWEAGLPSPALRLLAPSSGKSLSDCRFKAVTLRSLASTIREYILGLAPAALRWTLR